MSISHLVFCLVLVITQVNCGQYRSPERCQGTDCDFTLDWNKQGTQTVFTLTARTFLNSDAWAAFALSKDQRMGDDNVIVCKTGKIEHMYNSGPSTPSFLVQSSPTIGLSGMFSKNKQGLITCTVTRNNSMPGVNNYFRLSSNYYILFAYGQVGAGGKMQYHRLRIASTSKYFI
jgi:hypothetical protein